MKDGPIKRNRQICPLQVQGKQHTPHLNYGQLYSTDNLQSKYYLYKIRNWKVLSWRQVVRVWNAWTQGSSHKKNHLQRVLINENNQYASQYVILYV